MTATYEEQAEALMSEISKAARDLETNFYALSRDARRGEESIASLMVADAQQNGTWDYCLSALRAQLTRLNKMRDELSEPEYPGLYNDDYHFSEEPQDEMWWHEIEEERATALLEMADEYEREASIVPAAPECHPFATDLAKALVADACPHCKGTGKAERIWGGPNTAEFGRLIYVAPRPYCKFCGGIGVEEETLRAIYEGESAECAAIVANPAIEAALVSTFGYTWSELEDKWADDDREAAYEARYDDGDAAFDAARDRSVGG